MRITKYNYTRITKAGTVDRRHSTGQLATQRAKAARFDTDTGFWLCKMCGSHKPAEEFRTVKNSKVPGSRCKACAYAVSYSYAKKKAVETAEARAVEAQRRRIERMAQRQAVTRHCDRCGHDKPLADWPKEGASNRPLKYCCSAKNRSWADVEEDIRLGSKVCKHCNERKAFEHFSPHPQRKDGRQTVCRMCRSAKTHSGEWHGNRRRQALIDERTDGTITTEHTKKIFSVKVCPCCDGYMEWDDKVLDHIIPLKLGGMHSVNNVTVMCRSCNSAKSAYHPAKWLHMLREDAAERMRIHYASMGLNFDV
jgi:protein-arginine kinase activator protein McsA